MEVTVELCPPDEWEPMVKIFTEMEKHYYGKGIIQEPLLKNYLRNRLFISGTLVLRARCDANIVGLACCSILYPSPRYSGQLHLKELYVSQNERGKGTGKRYVIWMSDLGALRRWLRLNGYTLDGLPTDKFLQQEFLYIADAAEGRRLTDKKRLG